MVFSIRTLILSIISLSFFMPGVAFSQVSKGINLESSFKESIVKYTNIKWVTIENIEKSLPNKPINVGFALDDTLFFSSACYYKSNQEIIKQKGLQGVTEKEVWNVVNNEKEYWNDIAFCNAYYSIPKQSAIRLIKMHQARGDRIFFITARYQPTNQQALIALDDSIKALFPSTKGLILPVQYTNNGSKTPLIKKDKLSIYYGDSNNDILDAKKAGARAIRFLRSEASINLPLPLNGQYGEEVLVGSYN